MAAPRTVLVTGGTSGIGLAAALRFAAEGDRVVINGRTPERGEAARRQIAAATPGADVAFIAADMADPAGADALVSKTVARFGQLEVLVTCAGGDFSPALFKDISAEAADGIVRHWLLGTIQCCRAALPHLSPGAAIITVASDAAKVPTPGEAVIGAAMAGIAMFARTLAIEAKRDRIRVNAVTPSLVLDTLTHDRITQSGFSAKLFEKAARQAHLGLPEPDDVAALIAFLASPQAAHLTGQVISVNGGISAG